MAMLMTPMAIAGMAKMAIMAIMVTSVMANGNFSMAVRGIHLKGTQKLWPISQKLEHPTTNNF